MCFFNSKHDKDHDIIEINKRESIEDNGISYKEFISEFDEIFQRTKNLKLKIEKEIEKINNSYKKVENEIILSFKKQHLELEEKEKNLKLELNLKINQIKDELEKNLTISNNIILSCEKTNEIINKYEEKINNDIKTLYYISEINKSKEKAEDLVNKKIKNYDISFESDKYVCYDEYYFNGIPFPKNIKAEKKERKLYISWNLDNSGLKYINTDNIKYSLSIKMAGNLKDYECETSDKYYNYNHYDEKKDYEIKVRTSFDGCQSEWYEINKAKSEDIPPINIFEKNDHKKDTSSFPSLFSQNFQPISFFGINNKVDKSDEKSLFGNNSFFSNNTFKNKDEEKSTNLFPNTNASLFGFSQKNVDKNNSGFFSNIDNKGGFFGNNINDKNNDNESYF